MPPESGLLVINADDLGLNVSTTDAILDCFRGGRISSASAMVWMPDSVRAAQLAHEYGLPVRLHLNFTAPFAQGLAPKGAQERQARLARYFGRSRLTSWFYNPLLRSLIERSLEDQFGAFSQLFGSMPTTLDGHQHVHTCPNVLYAHSLERVSALRPTFTFLPDEASWANRIVRAVTNHALRRRFLSTRWFFALRKRGSPIDHGDVLRKVRLADVAPVELMVHPGMNDEHAYLMSDEWAQIISRHRVGTVEDLY
jgi:predicted glycoside hydrolase/deacetylase ChbG (UPF0249 family)